MIIPDLSQAVWRKSSRSGTNADCVEIAVVPGVEWPKSSLGGANAAPAPLLADASGDLEVLVGERPARTSRSRERRSRVVAVRDSKDQNGPVLAFAADDWSAFLADVKTDSFDPV